MLSLAGRFHRAKRGDVFSSFEADPPASYRNSWSAGTGRGCRRRFWAEEAILPAPPPPSGSVNDDRRSVIPSSTRSLSFSAFLRSLMLHLRDLSGGQTPAFSSSDLLDLCFAFGRFSSSNLTFAVAFAERLICSKSVSTSWEVGTFDRLAFGEDDPSFLVPSRNRHPWLADH